MGQRNGGAPHGEGGTAREEATTKRLFATQDTTAPPTSTRSGGATTALFAHSPSRPEADAAAIKRSAADALERAGHPDAPTARARVAEWGQWSPRARDEMLRARRLYEANGGAR
jgi:CO/xanthine dehydrogenase Mo-binding subunit